MAYCIIYMSTERIKDIAALFRIFIAIATAAILSLIGYVYMVGASLVPIFAIYVLAVSDALLLLLYFGTINHYDT